VPDSVFSRGKLDMSARRQPSGPVRLGRRGALISSMAIGLAAAIFVVSGCQMPMSQSEASEAIFSASPESGSAPLTVTFSHVGSSIDFGDGSLGPFRTNGVKVGDTSHTYT